MITKASTERLDYIFDFSNELISDDGIASYEVTAQGSIEVAHSNLSGTTGVKVWLQGGTPSEACYVTVSVTGKNSTSDTIDDRVFSLKKFIRIV